jgi:sialic acid synthase SpsE
MTPFVAEFGQKSVGLSKKQQLTPGPSRGAIFDCDKPDFILKNGPWKGRKLYDLYKATEPPRAWFPELLLHARKIGITIFSSVFSPEDVDFLKQFNPPAYEIASADRPFALLVKIAESEMHNLTCAACMRRIALDYDRLAKLAEEQLADQGRGATGDKT